MSETNSKDRILDTKTVFAIGASLVALVAGAKTYNSLTQPDSHSVPVDVRMHDSPWSVASRAEQMFGDDPADFRIADEADRIAKVYGPVLHPGEQITVEVK